MYIVLIVNPVSGRHGAHPGRVRAAVERAVGRLTRDGHDVEAMVTMRPGHATDLAAAALERGVDRVVAWGGDGTVNEVANALVGTGCELAVLPSGSGSGFARALGLPLDARRALAIVTAGHVRAIDVGRAGARAFVNVAGTGLDARIARVFNEARRGRLGLAAYVRLTVRELWRYTPRPCRVTVGDDAFDVTPLVVAFANSPQYGNGACIAPRARLDDGRLDAVIVEATTALADLWRARRLFTGTLEADRRTVIRQGVAMRVDADGPVEFHVDGEPVRLPVPVPITVQPGALRVVVAEAEGARDGRPGAAS